MKEFIEFIAKALVDHPESVSVTEIEGEKTTVYELRVGEGDLGKVIGRGGQTARSMRTLLTAVSAKHGKRAVLEIVEPEPSPPGGAEGLSSR
ncbi:MAG: RNA-binding protein [candidate division Zixibacteria bacterium 4484_93]|nr:MAG: RNA-binding protein [candidate division Zixibacteria bacterium 4484_93]RKZ34193.1 MAG: RNA-binding protein [bacterium]